MDGRNAFPSSIPSAGETGNPSRRPQPISVAKSGGAWCQSLRRGSPGQVIELNRVSDSKILASRGFFVQGENQVHRSSPVIIRRKSIERGRFWANALSAFQSYADWLKEGQSSLPVCHATDDALLTLVVRLNLRRQLTLNGASNNPSPQGKEFVRRFNRRFYYQIFGCDHKEI